MSAAQPQEELIFNKVRQMPAAERAAYLEQVCAGDAALARRIDALLAVYDKEQSFLASPVLAPFAPTITEPQVAEKSGTVIGPFKLLEQIGEGGFGIVFMAEQQQPVRRKVALKVLKPGMDTRQVIARFEAERQALALMDHPNIAKVLDAGATESGRPYFVMELVKGVAITEYCDQHQLTPRERLELFVPVCHAVQHAHQKGIIHRDIKPSNVLVTKHDGIAVVKVIDFGVAKALGQQLTDKTIFTGFAQMIGTPLYMSPEQAELSGLDIDTRTDIYSLGVLLYELLTGTTPFDKERLKSAAFDEIRRMIREEEPPKPSTRLSELRSGLGRSGLPSRTSGTDGAASRIGPARQAGPTSLASVAALRKMEPRKLSQLVRGDLDWIVMKALEKDRNRRYETASGFALDIQRFLADEPVQACPPSAWYRFRKFVRRNRGPVLAAALLLLVLLVGIAGTTTGLLQALSAQKKERLALNEAEENLQTAREAVDKMYTRAAEEMRDKPQLEQLRRALLEDALRFYRGFLKKKSNDPAIRYESALAQRRVGEIYGLLGNLTASLENHREATASLTALAPQFANGVEYRDELARAHAQTGDVLLQSLRYDEGAASLEESIALREALTSEFPDRPSYLEDLARANIWLGWAWQKRYSPRGDPYLARGRELVARLGQRFPRHELSAGFKSDLTRFNLWRFTSLPHQVEALQRLEPECRDQLAAAEAQARKFPDAPEYQNQVAEWLGQMANVLAALNRSEEASQLSQRILEIRTRLATQYPDSPEFQKNLAWAHYLLGMALTEADRPDESLEHFRTAIALTGDLAERFPENLRTVLHSAAMLRDCPITQLRDPKRALVLALRARELGHVSWDEVATAQVAAGQYPEALETCEKASRAGQQSVFIPYCTALAYWHLGRQAEARELVRQIVQQVGSQQNQYWYTPEYRWKVRETAKLMGLESEDLKAADPEKVLRNGIALYRKLADERPDDPGLLKELIGRNSELYRLLTSAGRNEEAVRLVQEAIETLSKATREHGDVPATRDGLARSHHDLANLQSQQRHNADALKNQIRAADIWGELADDVPTEPAYRGYQAHVLTYNVAPLLIAAGRVSEAEVAYRQAIAGWEKLATLDPRRNDVWNAVGGLGNLLVNAGRFDEAEQTWTKAVEKWPDRAVALRNRAESFIRLGLFKEAAAELARAIDLADPGDFFAFYLHALLRVYVGDGPGYRDACRRMLERFEGSPNADAQHELAGVLSFAPETVVEPSRAVACAERVAGFKWAHFVAYRGVAHYRAGQFERAKAALEESQAIDANWVPLLVHSALAMVQHRLGNTEQASAELGKARSARDGRIEAMLAEVVGLWPPAWWETIYGELLYGEAYALIHGSPLPDDPRVAVLRGRALNSIGRTNEARTAFDNAFALQPESLLLRLRALRGASQSDDFSAELAGLRKFLAEHPNQPRSDVHALGRAHVQWGMRQWAARRRDEAEAALQQAAELIPELEPLPKPADHSPETLAAWQKLAAESLTDDEFRAGIGHAFWDSADRSIAAGRYEDAQTSLRRALEVFEKFGAEFPEVSFFRFEEGFAHWKLGWLMFAQNRFAHAEEPFHKALAVYQQLVEEHPGDFGLQLRLAQSHRELAGAFARQSNGAQADVEWESAAAESTKAIALKPDDWEAWSGRAFAHFHWRRWDAAVADFSRAIELAPQVHTNWWHRGHVYLHLGQWDKAAADFAKVVEQWPEGGEGWYLHAVALAQLDQSDKAVADLRQAVARGWSSVDWLKNDSRLNPLRGREDFDALLQKLERKEK